MFVCNFPTSPSTVPIFASCWLTEQAFSDHDNPISFKDVIWRQQFNLPKQVERVLEAFWQWSSQEIVRLPVRGSQCLPSIPGGLFCHRLCAARHGRGRRQRVGQPSPTAVLLHPGTQLRRANMKTNSRHSLQLIFLLWVKKKIGLDNITYSRLCTGNLAVHRSRTNSQKAVCPPRVISHSAGSVSLAHFPPHVHIDQCSPGKSTFLFPLHDWYSYRNSRITCISRYYCR